MTDHDPLARPGGSLNVSASPSAAAAAPPGSDAGVGVAIGAGAGQAVLGTPPARLLDLRAELKRARNKFRSGEFAEAAKAAEAVREALRPLRSRGKLAGDDEAAARLLHGASLALSARVRARQGGPSAVRASRTMFRNAIAFFDGCLPPPADSRRADLCRDYADYGIALHALGRPDDAFPYLRRARELGDDDPEVYILLGLKLHQEGKFEEAETTLRRAIDLAPAAAAPYGALADIHERRGEREQAARRFEQAAYATAKSGQLTEARRFLDRALTLGPAPDSRANAMALKGELLRQAGQYKQALEVLDQALAMDPKSALAWGVKADSLRQLGQNRQALKAFDQSLKLAPDDAAILTLKGVTLAQLKRHDPALAVLGKALRLNPDWTDALVAKGSVLATQGKCDEAIDVLRRAVDLAPDSQAALAALADACIKAERWAEAIVTLDRLIELSPDDPQVLGARGRVLRGLGRTDEALASLSRARDNHPAPRPAWMLWELAQLLAEQGKPADALPVLDELTGAAREQAAIWRAKGEALEALGRPDEALSALDRALKLEDEAPNVKAEARAPTRALRGRILCARQDFRGAEEDLRQALRDDPNLSSARADLGEVYRLNGRYDRAVQELDRALLRDPERAHVWRRRGHALLAMGRYGEAEVSFRRVRALQPNSASALADLGVLKHLTEDYDAAMRHLDSALKLDPHDAAILESYAAAACDCGEYDAVARLLLPRIRALRKQGPRPGALLYALLAWALQHLPGARRLRAARVAYQRACDPAAPNPYFVKGVANCLYLLGDIEAARTQYQQVIDMLRLHEMSSAADSYDMSGWCHYRMGEYDQAISYFVSTLSLEPARVSSRFDLGLALLHTDPSRADTVYGDALDLTRRKQARRQRGLLSVAVCDLDAAVRFIKGTDGRTAHSAVAARDRIHHAIQELGGPDDGGGLRQHPR